MENRGPDETLRMRRMRMILTCAFYACLKTLFRFMWPMLSTVFTDSQSGSRGAWSDLHCPHRPQRPSFLWRGANINVVNNVSSVFFFDPFTSNGLFYHNSLGRCISNTRVSGYFLLLLCIIEITVVWCKQCWPRSDAAFCGVWSVSALFANCPFDKMG